MGQTCVFRPRPAETECVTMCTVAVHTHIDEMLVIDRGGSHSHWEGKANQTPVSIRTQIVEQPRETPPRCQVHRYYSHFALWHNVTESNTLLKALLTAGREGEIYTVLTERLEILSFLLAVRRVTAVTKTLSVFSILFSAILFFRLLDPISFSP